jgi:hypothetical protein
LSSHGNAPPDLGGNDHKDDNEDDKEDGDKDEGDGTATFNEVARCLQGNSYLAERAGAAAADQPVATPPTNGMPLSSLAAATTAINDTIDDEIDETMTLTSGDKSIVATIAPFNEGPTSNRGVGAMSEVAISEGREDAIPHGSADNDNAIVVSGDLKCK